MSSPTSRSSAVANPVAALHPYGQSVWLDFIKRGMIVDGALERMIENDGLLGMTSNPTIFEKAIGGSTDYARDLPPPRSNAPRTRRRVFERLAIADIQAACD